MWLFIILFGFLFSIASFLVHRPLLMPMCVILLLFWTVFFRPLALYICICIRLGLGINCSLHILFVSTAYITIVRSDWTLKISSFGWDEWNALLILQIHTRYDDALSHHITNVCAASSLRVCGVCVYASCKLFSIRQQQQRQQWQFSLSDLIFMVHVRFSILPLIEVSMGIKRKITRLKSRGTEICTTQSNVVLWLPVQPNNFNKVQLATETARVVHNSRLNVV